MDSDEGKLFIGGIAWGTSKETLTEYFIQYAQVTQAVIMCEKPNGCPRGFGFVVFSDPSVLDCFLNDRHTINGRTPEPSQTVIDPNSLGETSVQPAPSKTVINLDSLRETSVQPPPPQTVINPKSLGECLVQPPLSQPIVDHEPPPNPINWAVEWQNTILTLCFTTAIGIAIQSMGKEFQFPPTFHWLSLANTLTFSALFVAKFIGRKSPAAVKVLEQVAVFLAATVFFLAVAIPLPPHFKYAAWAIYAVTMIIVFICIILYFFRGY